MPGSMFKKVVILGDAKAGKSSLVSGARKSPYCPTYFLTKGHDYSTLTLDTSDEDSLDLKIEIYDISITDKIFHPFIDQADIIIVAFDLTKPDSLSRSRQWFTYYNLEKYMNKIMLVGTKADALRPDSPPRHEAIADFGLGECHETSAKEGTGISQFISKLKQMLFDNTVHQDNPSLFTDAFKEEFIHREENTGSAGRKKWILSSLDTYKEVREERSKKEYISFFGGSVARLFGGFSKKQKFDAVEALKKAIVKEKPFSMDPKHAGPLSQGRLGRLLKKHNIDLAQYIDNDYEHHQSQSASREMP